MKTNLKKIGAALLAVGICVWSTEMQAQTSTTTVTTTKGAFTEYVPGSETVIVRSEINPDPLRYVVTKQTTIVDESGAPVTMDRISPGSPLSVEYATTGDRLVASRIVVQRPATSATTVTTAPATAPVTTERTSTTTTRPLTHDEKEAREEAREDRKEQLEDQIDKRKDALEKAKDAEEERLDDMKDKLDDH